MLKGLQKKAFQWFGKFTGKHETPALKHALESAHMNVKADAYMASSLLYALIAFMSSLIIMLIMVFLIVPMVLGKLTPILIVICILIPLAVLGLTYLLLLQIPSSRAKSRGKKIERDLSYALNFVSAMAAAGVTPTEIFKSLSLQNIYGEVKEEASWIYRDIEFLGKDFVSAVRANIERTPSEKFSEFLQGLIVTVTSGGSLKNYFVAKASQFTVENRQKQKQMFENLGIVAESYVTSAVAGILLILIVIPLMMIISGDANQINTLYFLVFLIVPMIHIAFAYSVFIMSEVN